MYLQKTLREVKVRMGTIEKSLSETESKNRNKIREQVNNSRLLVEQENKVKALRDRMNGLLRSEKNKIRKIAVSAFTEG